MTPLAVHYDVDGLGTVEHHLLGIGARALESGPMLEVAASYMRDLMGRVFETEGPGWQALAGATVAAKGSSVIGRETDAMMDSLTQESAEGHLQEIFGEELVFGTNLTNAEGFPYPTVFDAGREDGSQPARPIFNPDVLLLSLRGFTKAIQAYLIGLDRAEFGVNMGGDYIAGSDRMPVF